MKRSRKKLIDQNRPKIIHKRWKQWYQLTNIKIGTKNMIMHEGKKLNLIIDFIIHNESTFYEINFNEIVCNYFFEIF